MDDRGSGDAPWERVGRRAHGRGAALSAAAGAAWIGLALWRPTTTFHLAPVLAAGVWPWSLRTGALRAGTIDARRGAIGGLAVTVVAVLVILLADAMRGPTMRGSGPALVEVVPAALVGAFAGWRRARCSPIG